MSRPKSVSDLFWSFTWLALQGFGGVLAVVQRELVEKKQWLTREEFIGFLKGNVIKYSLRAGRKEGSDDAGKARHYMQKLSEVTNGIHPREES